MRGSFMLAVLSGGDSVQRKDETMSETDEE
jgi:hypothetical protein